MIEEIRKLLRQLGNKNYATRLHCYFKTGKGEYGEGDKFIGIRVPVLRKTAKIYKHLSISDSAILLKSPFHEERFFALLILKDIFKKSDENTKKRIFSLYLKNTRYVNNWDLVDSSARDIVGGYLFEKDKTPIYILTQSENVWERRISIMATSYFIGENEFKHTLKIAAILLDDKEDLIHKAVGWLLREIGNRDIKTEEAFLKKYYKKMPRTMLRYAIERLPDIRRKSYLNGNI